MKNYAIRHGDLCLIAIDKLPEGLKKSDTKTLMTGSNNNPHTFDNGEFYPARKDNFIFGYFVAKDTTLFHKEHGKVAKGNDLREAKINDGIYELRNQVRFTHEGMRQVQD